MDKLKSYLPWHTTDPSSGEEYFSEDDWLHLASAANIPQENIQKISQGIRSQEMQTPSSQVLIRLLNTIDQPAKYPWISKSWIWGIPLMLLIFSILWLALQPGNQLQWAAYGGQPASFQIYRAPAGTMAFELIEELPATPLQQTYRYADALVLPGQTYQYRVEVRDLHGNTITSTTASSNTWLTTAYQIAILLTGFMLTFGIITIIEEIKPLAWPNLVFS